jgi:hypothetical protein
MNLIDVTIETIVREQAMSFATGRKRGGNVTSIRNKRRKVNLLVRRKV